MKSKNSFQLPFDRRQFLKTAGVVTAGAMLPAVGCATREEMAAGAGVSNANWVVQPFPLTQVSLGDGVFAQKRDLMLNYARNYGSAEDVLAGPDRMLSIFRANAGLDTKGARPPGGWEDAVGYLRGHYAGHFMSMLAQSYASTGDDAYKQKLDYMVDALGECQDALATAASQPTPRVEGRNGGALRLTGSPIGLVEHVRLPDGVVDELSDFTIATWFRLHEYDPADLPRANRDQTPATLNNQAAVFDFGSPNPEYGEEPLAHMYLTVRVSDENPVPRFAITNSGEEGEQQLDGAEPLPVDEWVHLAVARRGTTGTLYVNGNPVASTSNMTLGPADMGGSADNWLGRRQFPQRSTSYLNGTLDEFHIYAHGLSDDEVLALAESGEPGAGDVVAYRFDEENGPFAVDSSGAGNDAEILAQTDGRRHPGYLSAYPETQFIRLEEFCTYGSTQGIWAPYYTLHKIMAGLLDAHEHTGNARALEVLQGIGDWAHARLEPLPPEQLRGMWDIYIAGEYGGVNESLAALHALTGNDDYLAAAARFDNAAVLGPVVAGEDALDGRHANQHIPQFTGYLRMYEGNQDPDYYAAAANFWDMVVPHRIYSHGGIGVGEMLRERDVIAGSLYDDRNHAETCPLYNHLKLGRNLFFHDPDPKYMNYYELGLFNQMLASRRDVESAESPEVTYFVPVQPGSRRRYGNTGTCCGGTGMESHTKYQDSIYFHAAGGEALYVNLYIASTLEWPERGFTIRQETSYPEEGASTLTVEGSGALDIRLRVPTWVRKGYTVSVNGEVQDLVAEPGTYVSLDRDWSAGDRIEISMPFSFRAEPAIDDPAVQSIYYGPTLLAVQSGPVGEDLETGLIDLSFYSQMKLDGDLAPAMTPAGDALHFTSQGHTLAPFYIADPVAGALDGADAADTALPAPVEGGGRGRGPDSQPYHLYIRRSEPSIVFGSVDSGVANAAQDNGVTFLDTVWREAPFASHDQFMATVESVATEWQASGLLTGSDGETVIEAARGAEAELSV